jgi:CTP synthase (UTP-ammonia lyase)
MQKPMVIAIVGDFNPANPSHLATNDAIGHSSAALGLAVEPRWIATEELAGSDPSEQLADCGGLWISPGSPYKSMDGALAAIRFAREQRIPLLGTCGGFQHIILEYARNVLGFSDAEHEESAPQATRQVISRLSCSLVGRTASISLKPDSLVARTYGRTRIQEEYRCNFGLNPEYADALRSTALRIVGSDDEGAVRVVELAEHPFFVGTLFVPQHTSSPSAPHPLVSGFVKASRRSKRTEPLDAMDLSAETPR